MARIMPITSDGCFTMAEATEKTIQEVLKRVDILERRRTANLPQVMYQIEQLEVLGNDIADQLKEIKALRKLYVRYHRRGRRLARKEKRDGTDPDIS